jgi:hypothetical protein
MRLHELRRRVVGLGALMVVVIVGLGALLSRQTPAAAPISGSTASPSTTGAANTGAGSGATGGGSGSSGYGY